MGDTHINISRDMFHLAMRAITRSAFGDFFSNDEELETLRKVYEAVCLRNFCWCNLRKHSECRVAAAAAVVGGGVS